MDIGKRLRELREGKGLSQGDIEHDSGLIRCYQSRVENGHTIPSLPVLERWATALEVKLHQIFANGNGQPETPKLPEKTPVGHQAQTLLGVFGKLPSRDRSLLISLARKMVKRNGQPS
jgi:transcriptional regulator with XRE-family HTH domain